VPVLMELTENGDVVNKHLHCHHLPMYKLLTVEPCGSQGMTGFLLTISIVYPGAVLGWGQGAQPPISGQTPSLVSDISAAYK